MLKYSELSVARIGKYKEAVISRCYQNDSEAGYTLAQRVEFAQDNKRLKVFLKGSIHIQDLDALYNLRDAVNQAIDEIESK
jgi:hypothetical protein